MCVCVVCVCGWGVGAAAGVVAVAVCVLCVCPSGEAHEATRLALAYPLDLSRHAVHQGGKQPGVRLPTN